MTPQESRLIRSKLDDIEFSVENLHQDDQFDEDVEEILRLISSLKEDVEE